MKTVYSLNKFKTSTNVLPVLESRKERRKKAKKEGVTFEPQYTVSNAVVSYEEFHKVGVERFNSKQVTFKEVEDDSKYYFKPYKK